MNASLYYIGQSRLTSERAEGKKDPLHLLRFLPSQPNKIKQRFGGLQDDFKYLKLGM